MTNVEQKEVSLLLRGVLSQFPFDPAAIEMGIKEVAKDRGHDVAEIRPIAEIVLADLRAKANGTLKDQDVHKGNGKDHETPQSTLQKQSLRKSKPSTATPSVNVREKYGIQSLADIIKTTYPDPKWAIPGILPEGLTLLAGPPKVKKSWLALSLAIAVSTGGKALGRIDVEQGRVLYLALEDRERRLQSRAKLILADGGANPHLLDIATAWNRLDKGGEADLRQYLTDHKDTRFVIIDTWALVRPQEKRGKSAYDDDYQALGVLKKVADDFAVSMLVITHTRKMEADDFLDTVAGTHGLSGSADGLLVLKRARCSDTGILSVTGRDIENEAEHVLEWHKRTCTWHLTDASAQEMKLTPERRRIVEILRASDTPLSGKHIAERYHGKANLEPNSKERQGTRQALSRMLRDGLLQKDDKGGYSLPDVKNTVTPVTPVTPVTAVTAVTAQPGTETVTPVTPVTLATVTPNTRGSEAETTTCQGTVTPVTPVTVVTEDPESDDSNWDSLMTSPVPPAADDAGLVDFDEALGVD